MGSSILKSKNSITKVIGNLFPPLWDKPLEIRFISVSVGGTEGAGGWWGLG